jgi:hypothetical protein
LEWRATRIAADWPIKFRSMVLPTDAKHVVARLDPEQIE